METFNFDIVLKVGKELGIPLVILGFILWLVVYKIFPALMARDKEKDEANRLERAAFIDSLNKATEKNSFFAENIKETTETFKESLDIMKNQNRDVLRQIKDEHKDLLEAIKEDLDSLSSKFDELLSRK